MPRPRVLFLAHQFPPIGGAVGRNVGTARYLPEHGYEPIVVTGPGALATRWTPRDDGLVDAVGGAETHRVPGAPPANLSGSRARFERWLERPRPWVPWWVESAVRTGRAVGRDVDVIFASLIPYETAFAAATLARELGKPWVADLEDPWALDEMRVAPTILNHRVDLARMRRGLATASAIVMNCPEAAVRVRRELPELTDRPVVAIPTGYDGAEFADAPPPPRDDDRFRIVHTGSLHTAMGLAHRRSARARRLLGGTSVDVDIHTRSHVYLLAAIDRLIASEPALGGRIDVVLAGAHTDVDRAVAAGRGHVRLVDHLPHAETVALMRSADLLFLPMHELPHGHRAGLVPCKTYEYVASGRPILAAVPDGDARDLLTKLRRAAVVRPADVAGMANAIRDRMVDPKRGVDADPAEEDLAAEYERRRIVRRIAGTLDEVIGTPTAFAASASVA